MGLRSTGCEAKLPRWNDLDRANRRERAEVRHLLGAVMSERHVVPGRVYTSWGWRGLDQMRSQVLAMLAASLPATGDDGAGQWVREFAGNEALFAAGDAAFRRLDSTFKAYEQALGEQLSRDLFERGVHALAPGADVETASARLHAIFTDAIATIHEQRTQRLRVLPIDPEKWNTLVQAMSGALGPELYCFQDFRVEKFGRRRSPPKNGG